MVDIPKNFDAAKDATIDAAKKLAESDAVKNISEKASQWGVQDKLADAGKFLMTTPQGTALGAVGLGSVMLISKSIADKKNAAHVNEQLEQGVDEPTKRSGFVATVGKVGRIAAAVGVGYLGYQAFKGKNMGEAIEPAKEVLGKFTAMFSKKAPEIPGLLPSGGHSL